jgi:tripeptidyl-peptidase-1
LGHDINFLQAPLILAPVRALYGIPTTRATRSTNRLGVSGFINQFANQADLQVLLPRLVVSLRLVALYLSQEFLTNFRTDISLTTTFTLQTLDGGVNTQNPRSTAGIEAVSRILPP